MKEKIYYHTDDSPELRPGGPLPGDQRWDMHFPLQDGKELHLIIGKEGMRNLRKIILAEIIDELFTRTPYSLSPTKLPVQPFQDPSGTEGPGPSNTDKH